MSFKINYKGCNMVLEFEYKCMECGHLHIIEQRRSEEMRGRKCPCKDCDGELSRYIHKAPSIGADYHDSLRTYNIGWSDEC